MTDPANKYFDARFTMRYYETDGNGLATPTSILTMLENAAADHCEAIGHGLFDLSRRDIGWVLLSGFLEIERYPRYREDVTVRTWLSGYTAVRGYRENLIFDDDGNTIGRANSLWVYYDVNRRRPVKIPEEIRDAWGCAPEKCVEKDIDSPLSASSTGGQDRRYRVSGFDTDTNRHVNNIRYLQWALDALDDDFVTGKSLRSINGRFTGEAHLGDEIVSHAGVAEETGTYVHSVTALGAQGDRDCAMAISRWV